MDPHKMENKTADEVHSQDMRIANPIPTSRKILEKRLREEIKRTNLLRNKMREKDEMIRSLGEEIKRRDKILDLSLTTSEQREVNLLMSEDGHRIYEIKSKENVPFWIKTERLSPKGWEQSAADGEETELLKSDIEIDTDDEFDAPFPIESGSTKQPNFNFAPAVAIENPSRNPTAAVPLVDDEHEDGEWEKSSCSDGSQSPQFNSNKNSNNNHHAFQHENINENGHLNNNNNNPRRHPTYFESPPKSTSSLSESESPLKIDLSLNLNGKSRRKRTISSSSTETETDASGSGISRSKSRRAEVDPDLEGKIPGDENEDEEEYSPFDQLDSVNGNENDITNFNSSLSQPQSLLPQQQQYRNFTLPTSVMQIPQVQRINFGCSELWDLNRCPVALKFWYDEENAALRKFFIRLYDDRSNWEENREFVVKEQVDLSLPNIFKDNFQPLIRILQETPNKRIWIDVRDFRAIFSQLARPFFSAVGEFITHFSFGSHLYSCEVVRGNILLEFVFENLPNLEFLSINDEMLFKLDSVAQPRNSSKSFQLEKLKTLRLIHSKFTFCAKFVFKITKMAPNINCLYGIPLHFLEELERLLNDEGKSFGGFSSDSDSDSSSNSFSNSNSKSKCGRPIFIKSIFIKRSIYSSSSENFYKFQKDLTLLSKLDGRLRSALEELDARTFFIFDHGIRTLCVHIMSKILEQNRYTLTSLSLERLSSATDFLDIPVLPSLKFIQFDLGRVTVGASDFWSYFPFDFDLDEKFPRLSSVEIHQDARGWKKICSMVSNTPKLPGKIFEQDFPRSVFKRGFSFNTVESLYLYFFTPALCMKKIAGLYRNLTVLRVFNNLMDIAKVLPSCFENFQQLQQLILETDTDSRWGNLDSALTGIPDEKCKILERAKPYPHEEEKVLKRISSHRDKPAVWQLKDLRLFKIILRSAYDNSYNRVPIFTPVAVMYGFGEKRMPNLHVHVSFEERVTLREKSDMRMGLQIVKPYVDIEI